MRGILALLCSASCLVAAPIPKDRKVQPDSERILGVWIITKAEWNGRPHTLAIWSFEENKMFSRGLEVATGKGTEWAIRLDPNQSPKQISIGEYAGIYRFDGDELTIVFNINATYPKDFTSTNGQYLNILKRHIEKP